MVWPWKEQSSPSEEGERCGTRTVVRSSCTTEEVEPGRFVRKCDKTHQILRDCVGRPAEVIESKTEHTEEDVTEEMARGSLPFGSSELEPFSFPGLRSDIENIERGVLGGLDTFLQAAEEMKNELFHSFGIPPSYRGSSPYHGHVPLEQPPPSRGEGPRQSGSVYGEFAGKIRDV